MVQTVIYLGLQDITVATGATNTEMATMRPTSRKFDGLTQLEKISSMTDLELADGARRGGIDSIYEISYRLQGAAASRNTRCHDGVMADPELDIGV
jgi:hypothetical protein